MRSLVFLLVIVGFVIFRNQSLRNIFPGSYIVDKFNRCTNETDNFVAPTAYIITPSYGNITVFLMDDENYYNMECGYNYTTIKTYHLKSMINYHINLTKHYHNINGPCHIVTKNNNDYHLAINSKYLYPPFWKHLIYIATKEDVYFYGFDM